MTRSFVLAAAALSIASASASADSDCAALASAPRRTVTPAARYAAGGIHRFLLGSGNRILWTTPIAVPVLDLHSFSGGLTVKERAGSKQTRGLKLEAKDGRHLRFRSTDKLSSLVPKALKDTFVESIVDDQGAADNPFGALVVTPLSHAAGIPSVGRCLVVLPDDPALGEFRAEFAGMLGTLEPSPQLEAPTTPGFEAFTQLLETEELVPLLDASPAERIDARAFLKARLFDMWLGDWDRHSGQWDWGRRKSDGRFAPLPKDRDEAFTNHDGLLIGLARSGAPRVMDFGASYRPPLGYIYNSRDQDRRFLAELGLPVWNEVVAELRASLSDAVIDQAVQEMPREHRGAPAAHVAAVLKARRDRLPQQATAFYRLISDKVDVFATAADEIAEIRRLDSGEVEVSLATVADRSTPYFQRRFEPSETAEIRVYLKDGNDRIVTSGRGSSGPLVRIVGGNGQDLLEGAPERIRVYETENASTRAARQPYEDKLDENGNRPFDWGSSTSFFPTVDVETDIGLIVGGALSRQTYGFRARPYRTSQALKLETATGTGWRAEYEGDWRRIDSQAHTRLIARYSEIESLRFFGFGNETLRLNDGPFYHVDQKQYLLAPTWIVPRGAATWSFGPVAKYSTTDLGPEHFIGTLRPYGTEAYGQLGATAGYELDTRDSKGAARSGVRLRASSSLYPAVWSVRETFGEAHADLAVHIPIPAPLKPSLALRIGGKQLFGLYPFHEAAYLGGMSSVRGISRNRYAGDASAFANAELRLRVGRLPILLPINTGIFGLADAGRVFLDGETSERWHSAVGGGIWFSAKHDKYVLSLTSARSEGRMSFYVKSGMAF